MNMQRSTRKLLVLCGIAAAWRGERQNAESVASALPLLVSDEETRQQCEKIFAVLLDNRRLTQPSYSPCEELHRVLEETPTQPAAYRKYQPV